MTGTLAEALYELRRLADTEQARADELLEAVRGDGLRMPWNAVYHEQNAVYHEQHTGAARAYRDAADRVERALGFPPRGAA
jgi:hypothetical protein